MVHDNTFSRASAMGEMRQDLHLSAMGQMCQDLHLSAATVIPVGQSVHLFPSSLVPCLLAFLPSPTWSCAHIGQDSSALPLPIQRVPPQWKVASWEHCAGTVSQAR